MNKKAKVFGLTGGIGTGKTTISNFLKEKGAYIINADEIGHKVILKGEKAYYETLDYFGAEILDSDTKEIDRKKLGEIVFSDKAKLLKLNQITHKYIKKNITGEIQKAKKLGHTLIVLEMAILIEAKFQDLVEETWLLHSSAEERIKRITKRDGITPEMAKKIMQNQRDFQEIKNFADHIVFNQDIEQAKSIFAKLLKN